MGEGLFELIQLKLNAFNRFIRLITQLTQHITKQHSVIRVAVKQGRQHSLKGGRHPDRFLVGYFGMTLTKDFLGKGVGVDRNDTGESIEKACFG